jgi:hypothetical protein
MSTEHQLQPHKVHTAVHKQPLCGSQGAAGLLSALTLLTASCCVCAVYPWATLPSDVPHRTPPRAASHQPRRAHEACLTSFARQPRASRSAQRPTAPMAGYHPCASATMTHALTSPTARTPPTVPCRTGARRRGSAQGHTHPTNQQQQVHTHPTSQQQQQQQLVAVRMVAVPLVGVETSTAVHQVPTQHLGSQQQAALGTPTAP